MALKIIGAGADLPTPKESAHPQVTVDQIEVFGRLRMTKTQIAEWYGLTVGQVAGLLRRHDLATAYDRGRAETVVAIRQKQLQVALGQPGGQGKPAVPPNVQMLIHAGYVYGDVPKDGAMEEPEDFEPGRFSWDAELKKRLQAAREALAAQAGADD